MRPMLAALALAALALTACAKTHSTVPPAAKASAHAEASALATQPAVVAAEATLGKCQAQAEHSAHPVTTLHACVKAAFPRGHGKALLRCLLGPAAAYFTGPRAPADLAAFNAKMSACAEQNP
jgi:hypothetical protein